MACSNYEVLRLHVNKHTEYEGLDTIENNTSLLNALAPVGLEEGDLSLRGNLSAETIEQALLQARGCISVDLSECYTADNTEILDENTGAVLLKHSSVNNMARDVSRMNAMSRGKMVIVTSTAGFRTKDSEYVREHDRREWEITTHDSFSCTGLVPGEASEYVHMVRFIGQRCVQSLENVRRSLDLLVRQVRTGLICCTNPVSYSEESIPWICYYHMGVTILRILRLANRLREGSQVDMVTMDGRCVLGITKLTDTDEPRYYSVMPGPGLLEPIVACLNGYQAKYEIETRFKVFNTLVKASGWTRSQEASWRLWMLSLAIQEAKQADSNLAKRMVMCSKVVNDWELDYSQSIAQEFDSLLDSKDRSVLLGNFGDTGPWLIDIEGKELDLRNADHRGAKGSDHDKIGVLRRPKSGIVPKRVAGFKLNGGRGNALWSGSPDLSYRSGTKRYSVKVIDDEVEYDTRTDLREDLNILRRTKEAAVHVTGVEWVKDDSSRANDRLGSTEMNALLSGAHGDATAFWLWAHILAGDIAVDQTARDEMSYLRFGDVTVSDKGYKIRAMLSGGCLKTAITYENGQEVWVDIFDNGKLRKLECVGPGESRISEDPVDMTPEEIGKLCECTIWSKRAVGIAEKSRDRRRPTFILMSALTALLLGVIWQRWCP